MKRASDTRSQQRWRVLSARAWEQMWSRWASRRSPRGTAPRARLAIEPLEDRTALSGTATVLPGAFETGPTGLELTTGRSPQAVVMQDLNKDGKVDLVVANFDDSTVQVWRGDGAGGFTLTDTVPVGTNPQAIALGDFNKDGWLDLFTANGGGSISPR